MGYKLAQGWYTYTKQPKIVFLVLVAKFEGVGAKPSFCQTPPPLPRCGETYD